jgi:transglutaminase-like putative cysteine protease
VSAADQPEASSIRLAVRHKTVFHYLGSVSKSVNVLHLEPRDFRLQKTLSSIIKVIPATRVWRLTDLYGNFTHHFELTEQHTRLEIESSIKVSNLPLNLSGTAYSAGIEAYGDSALREQCWPYLRESSLVSTHNEIGRQALDLSGEHTAVFEKAAAIMRWIYTEFAYELGTTDVATHPELAFSLRKGVCQDFAHIMLGMCRSIGIPARYASGYIFTGANAELVGAQASHAWCDVLLPDRGWVGFDPTNAVLADQRYVKIAVGRDYNDVSPIRGTYHGEAKCRMEVEVAVSRFF